MHQSTEAPNMQVLRGQEEEEEVMSNLQAVKKPFDCGTSCADRGVGWAGNVSAMACRTVGTPGFCPANARFIDDAQVLPVVLNSSKVAEGHGRV